MCVDAISVKRGTKQGKSSMEGIWMLFMTPYHTKTEAKGDEMLGGFKGMKSGVSERMLEIEGTVERSSKGKGDELCYNWNTRQVGMDYDYVRNHGEWMELKTEGKFEGTAEKIFREWERL